MEQKNLEKLHSKFAREYCCKECQGYHLADDANNKPEFCPRCVERGLDKKYNTKDVLYSEVNVAELANQVESLKAELERLQTKEKPKREMPKSFKPKDCVDCGTEFTPQSPAQKICSSCRDKLIS
jgi:hypothetical protein